MKCIMCYFPDNMVNNDIDYLCFDNRIHIRFRDYKSNMVIAGFEHKLTYLLTYLMNFSYLQNIIIPAENSRLIDDFLTTWDICEINATIKRVKEYHKYKGIKIKENYKQNTIDYRPFGKFNIDAFPRNDESGVVKSGNLNFFLKSFNISLEDYLFNDRYVIILDDISIDRINNKFLNKMRKRAENQDRKSLDLIELW